MESEKLIIIGSGPAGYTAAIYAARADLAPLVFAGASSGGQLMTTTDVENFPGFPDGIKGPELMALMRKQAERFDARIVDANADSVDFSVQPFKITSGGKEYFAQSVIISTGAGAKWLGVPGEDKLKGRGVSACATCDGFFFRNKRVLVAGGGDAAMEEANFLTKFATEVTVLVRGDSLRASKIMQERSMANPKIKILFNVSVKEVLGETAMTGAKIINSKTGEESEIQAEGLFASIGHEPNTKIFQGQLELDIKNYIVIKPGSTATSVDGVFAAGDVADYKYRQAITAAGTGCMAALDAEKWLAG
ncbi:TPA: thioredoxin-disulfide reductase, partial [Candidatus Uhrbacteria bacterium]|nr:thioredoxin-disulfide reductase [Candidatus Uhrbacteria bacterium]